MHDALTAAGEGARASRTRRAAVALRGALRVALRVAPAFGVALGAALGAPAGAAAADGAPRTVREVLERAPEPVAADALRALLTDARVHTRRADGVGFALVHHRDGTVTATLDRTALTSTSGTGRWFVRDGRYCALLRWQTGTVSSGDGFCVAVHRVGDAYFGVREDDVPESVPATLTIGGR